MNAPAMWDDLNRSVIDAFAESVPPAFIVGAEEKTAPAVFDDSYVSERIGGQQGQGLLTVLQMVETDLPAGVVEGSQVRVRGVEYVISEMYPERGLLTLVLSRYRA